MENKLILLNKKVRLDLPNQGNAWNRRLPLKAEPKVCDVATLVPRSAIRSVEAYFTRVSLYPGTFDSIFGDFT